MTSMRGFPHLKKAARHLDVSSGELKHADLRLLLCSDCDFYDDDHDDELECSCFAILRHLLSTGALTPERLATLLPGEEEHRE